MEGSFGLRLKQLRKERGLTQRDLGEMLGRGDSTVRMWELGVNQPSHEYLLRLAKIFDVSTDYLLGKKNAEQAYNRPLLQELMDLAADVPDEDLAALLRMAKGFLQK